MPKSRTVLKRQRQTEKRRVRNKAVRSELKTLEKRVLTPEGENAPTLDSMQRQLDKAAAKGVIHPNKAARKKSRIAKALNKLSASSS